MFSMLSSSSISLATERRRWVMGRGTERALQSDVAALGAHGDGNGVGQSVDALCELGAGIGVERNVLCMVGNPPKEM